MNMMKYIEWEKWYDKILEDFGFSKEEDERTANILNELLKQKNSLKLENLIDNLHNENLAIHNSDSDRPNIENFIVFGAGPSLKKDIKFIKNRCSLREGEDYILIVADGATSALLEENIIPDIIVTDLDGNMDDLMLANDLGSVFVLHAHGHNEDKILKYTEKLNKVMGTTQSKPLSNLYNFGGFTDGDRAVFLATVLGGKKIILAGMDFGIMTTKYSRPDLSDEISKADEVKQKKLMYAEKLVDWVKDNEDTKIINLSK
jgi:uncharacterized Rossmann fold enzyme